MFRAEKTLAIPFVDKRVMTLAMNSGGRMSKDFHTVLYAFAKRKVSTVHGDDDAGDEGEDGSLIERKQHIAREKKRMILSIIHPGAKGIAVLHLFPIFRQFFHFHKNPSSSVISGTFSRENRFPQKCQKRPKIAKHTKHEPLPKRDAIFATFP